MGEREMGVVKTLGPYTSGPVGLVHTQKVGIKYKKPLWFVRPLVSLERRGVGQSLAIGARGPAPLPLRDFFLPHRRFRCEKSDRVLAANCKQDKTIAASDTYGSPKRDERQAASAAAEIGRFIFCHDVRSLTALRRKKMSRNLGGGWGY